MVNPYYFLFYIFYLLLNPIAKDKTRLAFSIVSFMAILLILHSTILFIVIFTTFNIKGSIDMNKHLFGVIVTALYLLINYYLFERNNRYLLLINKIETTTTYKKVISAITLTIYIFIPFIIKILMK